MEDRSLFRGERPPCARCGEALGGQTTEALGVSFHTTCFTCYRCRRDLTDTASVGRIVGIGGQPHCGLCGKIAVLGTLGKIGSPETEEQRQKELAAQQDEAFQAKQDALLRGEHQTLGDPRKDRARGAGGRRPPTRAGKPGAARAKKTLTASLPAASSSSLLASPPIVSLVNSEPSASLTLPSPASLTLPSPASLALAPPAATADSAAFPVPRGRIVRSSYSNRPINPFANPFDPAALQQTDLFAAIPDDPDFNFFSPPPSSSASNSATPFGTAPAVLPFAGDTTSPFTSPFAAPPSPFTSPFTAPSSPFTAPPATFAAPSAPATFAAPPPAATAPTAPYRPPGAAGFGMPMPAAGSVQLRKVQAPPTHKEPVQPTAPVMPTLKKVTPPARADPGAQAQPVAAPLVKLRPVTAGPLVAPQQQAAAPPPSRPPRASLTLPAATTSQPTAAVAATSAASTSSGGPPARPRRSQLPLDEDIPVSREVATILEQNTITDVNNYSWEERWSKSWCGYLNKLDSEGSLSRSFTMGMDIWRKRWFLLSENLLVYYHHEQTDLWAKDHPPSGFIDLREAVVRPSDHGHSIEIVNPERTWHLEAKNRTQLMELLRAIEEVQRHFATVPLIMATSPLHGKELYKAGYLERRTNFGLSWTKNWIVLRGGTMYILKNEHAKTVLVSVPLHGAHIVEYKMDKFPNAFEVKSHRGHAEIFNTENEMVLMEWVTALIQQRVLIDEQMNTIVIN